MIDRDELIEKIIRRFGKNDMGCYINGKWFSPFEIIELIKEC